MFRLATEPRRLSGRYVRDDIPFSARLITSLRRSEHHRF
jgi:hypothetical protein